MTRKKQQHQRRKKAKSEVEELNSLIASVTSILEDKGAPYRDRLDAAESARKCIETRSGLVQLWTMKLEDLKYTDRIYG